VGVEHAGRAEKPRRPPADASGVRFFLGKIVSVPKIGRCDRNGIQRFRLSAAPQLSKQTGENAANCALSQQAQKVAY